MSTKSKSNLISQSSFHYFKQITDAFNKSFEAASYKPALLNILEMEETFTRTLGLSSDIVCKEMYSFEDKSGNKLVMRPEGTAGAMRMVMNNTELCKNIEKVPVKLSYWGPMYRYERPQAGRMRQFYQIGIERIGGSVVRGDNFDLGDALEGDLEAIQIGVTALSDIFKDHLKPKIYINNLGNRQSLDKYNQELIKYFSSNDKKLSELSFKRIENGNALRILDSKDQGDIELAKAAPPIDDFIDTKHREQFSELLKILQSLGIEYERDRNLVRGLDYYNGTCFEIKLESQDFTKNLDCLGESQNTVLAGGRYDYLAPHFGFNRADGLSSIGFAAGIDRLALVLEYLEQNKQVEASSKESIFGITFVIVISICDLQDKTESADLYPQLRLRCIEIQEKLRRLKPYTKVELDLRENLKLPDKLNYLMNHRGVTTALVVGSKELSTNTVTLKKDGQTKELAIADLRSVFECSQMDLLLKKDPNKEEYLLAHVLYILGMKKLGGEKTQKILQAEETKQCFKEFFSGGNFFFAIQASTESIQFQTDVPTLDKFKSKKIILVIRARQDKNVEINDQNIAKEVMMMEINRNILDNLYSISNEVFLPVLSNPLNQIGWSDLVSKDLMDKFHNFLAHLYVTIGQVKGRTMLPLPPNDVTSSDKTSSKDKAHILEGAIITWTKQIKNVLKQDPESALKGDKHPDPLTEIEFWKNKSDNLNSICEQLGGDRIKKVLKFLEQNKSTYTGPFSKLQKEVQTARQEANENCKYLQTLIELFNPLTDTGKDFTEIPELFMPIMHVILLIWTYSPNYNTPSRLVVLIREICNAIINQCRNYIDGEKIFAFIKNEEPKEAHDKLSLALDVCSKFKDAYFEYKGRAKNQWKITTNALFVRLDSFSERCQDIMHLTSTIIQFNKLQKIEIGNTKGKQLTANVLQIFDEFNKAVEEFMTVNYDIMDIEKRQFDDDFYKFRCRIKELERRLASILTQGFDDCDTIIGKFKLLDSFEGLLNRPIIQDELEKKHITLLELYKSDLKTVQQIFLEGKALVDKIDERAPIANNLPPISGALNWTAGLFERIKEPMERLSQLSQSIQDREEYKDVQKLYASICKNLKEFEDQKIKQWEQGVEESTEDKLNQFLLVREESDTVEEGFLKVNFDPVLVRLLREVKYLKLQDILVPDRASNLYQKVNIYRSQTGNLEIIVNMYNEILATLLPVEKPLLADRIERINKALQPGIDQLKWNSANIDPFINQCMIIVREVDELVKKMKDNVKKMVEMMNKWEKPLFERKNKPMYPDDLEQTHQSTVMPRLEDIRNNGKEIHRLMKDTADNIKPDKKSLTWLAYVDYVNGLVIEGITKGINGSMNYMSDQINIHYNKHNQLPPMFDIKVDLRDREVKFDPSIGSSARGNGIRDIIMKIMNDFISLAIQMPRLDTNTGDYLVEIKDQFELFGSMQIINNHLTEIEEATLGFISQYKEQEFLWKETLQNNFAEFLDKGEDPREKTHMKLNADGEQEEDETFKWMADKILSGVNTKKPALEMFDEKITFLTKVKHQIAEMKTSIDIGWLRVNSTPLIKELQKTVAEWIDAYTSFLLVNTVAEINNIQKFIDEVSNGIKILPEASETKREKELLMQVMTHLRDVKMIKDRTLEEIEPMKQTIMLMKKHQVKMDEDFLVKLENCKTHLVEVSEKALGPVKEAILPLQNQEAGNIKKKLSDFATKVREFRVKFQNHCPYHIEDSSIAIIDRSYHVISEFYNETCEIEEEAKSLNNLETLFDLQKSSYKQLKDCKNELASLKYMWDLVALIDLQFEAWKSTLWDKIDTDNLMQLIKDMQTKQTNPQNPQNKEIKNWKAFTALNDRVRNMNTILPLISQLHSKFMQERHWKKLMKITGKSINFNSPNFCLEDLIKLQLYNYSEEVTELVDGAQKEAKIESNLAKIERIWEEQKFEFKEYKDTQVLGSLDEIVEFVETHSMELMGMMSSKDVEEFKEKVIHWQKTLKTVDAVIQIWVKVQKNWQRLEPIFLASEDIRSQLPDDTKRFEKIDIEWKDMMREASEEPGVITAATYEGREELLNTFFTEIELCEKALNEYLEQKKKIFPRFYFVSNQALLDILSNGNNPEKVDEYLGDCFDGMKGLDFIRGEGEMVPAKRSKGMWSKEKEYVPFSDPFTCNGAVENYLCDLEKKMQVTLRDILEVAKGTADLWELEKKRHEWLEDYCAQISLLATQIMWTEGVTRAFDELEGGSEGAMKDYLTTILLGIRHLIDRVRQDLSSELRIKIITIITIDVHERDVVEMFANKKIQDSQSFAWQSQLKFYWEFKNAKEEKKTCVARICDWTTYYNYEYVGNCGRLVITPLTDRCYITLTQALNLTMGGAPAGPAGTGKTETTKDLGRALGLQVVVFNCSDQMNYQSMAQIFMGLAQTGSWGCFDEFNRISIEVLSVVSTQVKYVLDALREMKHNPAKNMFMFQDDEIQLKVTVGFFITMNPGYAGRTELPENLKALFRSCAMVVPDIVLICENMLMSEGFTSAKELSKKFMTLYDLAKSLLSKQIHYDWGLRAVKSVLRQAGKLKRADPDISEDPILMRALRDFNWPKIIVDDRNIFLGLIKDLFPGIEAEPKVNEVLNKAVAKVAKAAGLQAEEGFILKCVQLAEILEVRHCCFIIGNSGCGKTAVWKTLSQAFCSQGQETIFDITDPKAVTSDELFGCMNPKTKEWKDGVLSTIMRDMNKNNGPYKLSQFYKWIILDGDVDPEWIESLNTVMDDNKVLTLVSQERIPLTPEMRLLLEVSNLRNATPATVSRGGVLFINDTDVGWKPYFESWMSKFKKKNDEYAINVFTLALTQYLNDSFIDDLRGKEKIAPTCDMAQIQTLTTIIDALYNELYSRKDYHDQIKQLKEAGRDEDIKQIYEGYFIFAVMWSFGASLTEDKISFNNILKSASKIKFPEAGQCYDYYYDPLQLQWVHWMSKVRKYEAGEGLFNNIVVPTAETTRQRFLIDMHVKAKKGVLYVGSAGTGKTTIIKDYFSTLDKEFTLNASINFNSYTDSKALQVVIESNVDKRAGKTFGPPPNKILIYFMDDLNMPYVDKYGTQSPICLIRQIIDYGIIYDRDHLEEKKFLVDIMFTACMNPKSGSFFVDLRLSRHFSLFSCLTAEKEILLTIYQQILDSHLCTFDPQCSNLTPRIVNATMSVFLAIANSPQFMPTAKKFHYQFNLRDFSKIIQNIMQSNAPHYRGNALGLVRMWVHECMRVFHDRLIVEEDRETFMAFLKNGLREFEFKEEQCLEQPLIYTSFIAAAEGHEKAYLHIKDMGHLKQVLENKLAEYNEQVSSMNLVLFDQAMEHITRIARIIDLPVGNSLLVGVGGSGKQSLSKLSAFILGYDVVRIVVTTSYSMADLKTDIQTMYQKAGVQGAQILFILTDSQITNDKFLVYINDILSSGWIPELFAKDELDGILGKVRAEAKNAGYLDTPDQLFDFFLDKARKNLHLALCFSPVGDAFRFRARKFPGIINCTSMDWFHEWPKDALIDVANRFLLDIELPSDELRDSIALHMSEVHLSIGEANQDFLQMERRFNYTTPTSYLELISFYKILLEKKRDKISDQINRLEIGLQTMKSTTEQVNALQELLVIKMVDVEKEKEKTGELIEIVGRESQDAEREQDLARIQEEETQKLANAAEQEKAKANKELEEAVPAMKAAEEAVACLDKKSIQELKSLANPPAQVFDVSKAVLLLRGEKKNFAWANAQKMMNNPQKFIEDIQAFDATNIDQWVLDQLAPIIKQEHFTFEIMKGKSLAAAYLCKWICNVVIYNAIYKKVKPLMDTAEAAEALANEKKAELAIVLERVRQINEKVDALKQKLFEAEEAKRRVEQEAQDLQDQLNLANRLTGGLADENKRWGENVQTYKHERITMIGNALVSAAFVSYIGPFSFPFRQRLWKDTWIPDIVTKKIPFTEGIDPLRVLASDSDQAKWKTEGLPADRVSLENAAVISSCKRYPLMIDPQLQGQKWIRGKEGNELQVIQLSQKGWLKKVELAVTNGSVLMIESLGQEIDAVLDPLLSRQFVKKGKVFTVKLGSEDVELSPNFKLYLQTKLFNPHYKPETAAQCTIINFIVTEGGLEDQLLAMVVRVEKPDLEQTKEELVNKQNAFQIDLARLEDELLKNLSDADPSTILQNKELIESLENTKKTSTEIQRQQIEAKETEIRINFLREVYRRVATEGAMLYFLLIQLCIVDHMYQYSLESFVTFFFKAIEKTEEFEEEEPRVLALREMIRKTIYQWVSRGLFEKHKQIFLCQLTFRLMQKAILDCEYTTQQMMFLLRCPTKSDTPNPLKEWLPDLAWYSIQKMIEIEGFEQFAQNLEKEAPNRFRDWYNELCPETEKLPLDWKKLESMPFQKLLVIRCLRPDRITTALDNFIRKILPNGDSYVDCDSTSSFFQVLFSSYIDSTPTTPIFFILSPGANPVKDVEALARKQGIDPNKYLHTVALGQGQDIVAMNKLEIGHKEGHWVMLQNIHLMPRFLIELEKKLDIYAVEGSHQNFRLYLSSDPSNDIPIGLLERSIKLTNEPPQGLKQNMKRAFTFFSKEDIEDKDPKIKTILFALCYFHTVMIERRKFGPKGWNMHYPFNMGDLRDSSIVLQNYMEQNAASGKIPWDDLRYIFGEIMYGGHIVDDWDRRFCSAFLENLMQDTLLDEAELFPFIEGKNITFKCPPPLQYEKYIEYLETEVPPETPLAFGMHPNAEIDFRTNQCNVLFKILVELQPKDSGSSGEGGSGGKQEKIQEFMHRVNDEVQLDQNKLNIEDIASKMTDERGPYQNVFLQECEVMNVLINEILRSLQEIELSFKGELTMTEKMEQLMDAIYLDKIPATWAKLAFPSTRGLGSWLDNLKHRLDQLNLWKEDPLKVPTVIFLNRLFNPQSFLTAIKQVYARDKQQELNRLYIQTEITKKLYWEQDLPPVKEGAYIFGFHVEGARWEPAVGQLEESFPKRQFSVVPVVNCRAALIPQDGKEEKGVYQCPVYKTETRGATYVFTAQLKTKAPAQKWILAGVAIILDVQGVADAYAPGKEVGLT